MKIKGKKILLEPVTQADKEGFFIIATRSYGSQFWYDDKEIEKRDMKAFFNDWKDYFFDINKPEQGQCFWIKTDDKKIGVVCYSEFDKHNKKTEIDIIIGDKEDLGKGYGTDALQALVGYLFKNFDLNKIWIEARGNNPRAIKAYQKAGFKKEGLLKEDDYFHGEFVDCVRLGILKKEIKK